MDKPYFEGVKVGMTVFSINGNPFEVEKVCANHFVLINYQLVDFNGRMAHHPNFGQIFFWAPPPPIVAPERPKRMVKRLATINGVIWQRMNDGWVHPTVGPMSLFEGITGFGDLIRKPPMTMTLEWEEEE